MLTGARLHAAHGSLAALPALGTPLTALSLSGRCPETCHSSVPLLAPELPDGGPWAGRGAQSSRGEVVWVEAAAGVGQALCPWGCEGVVLSCSCLLPLCPGRGEGQGYWQQWECNLLSPLSFS